MRRLPSLAVLLAALSAPLMARAQTQVVSEGPSRSSIVIYPQLYGVGLVMITETREVNLPAGPVTIAFRDVADQIVPQTVAVQGLPQAVGEQNYDFQLLTPGSLIRASTGRTVGLVTTNPRTGKVTQERARVVSGTNGAVLDIDGRIEALKCGDGPQRLVFDDLPPGFVARPTLSVTTVSPQARRAVLTLSYLATGISWKANYVAHLAPDGRSMDLSSWITIDNQSNAQFPDAPVQVIAGRMQRLSDTRPTSLAQQPFQPNCWRTDSGRTLREALAVGGFIAGRGGANFEASPPPPPPMVQARAFAPAPPPRPSVEDLGDYKLYTLPEPTTVAARQTKQLLMFDQPDVKFDRVFRQTYNTAYGSGPSYQEASPAPTQIVLELKNEAASGLGLALPAGQVAVFEHPDGDLAILAGQPGIRDTAVGLPLELALGQAVNVESQAVVLDRSNVGGRQSARVQVTLTNAQNSAASIEVREGGGRPNLEVTDETAAHILKDGNLEWRVTIPANGTVTLRYTLAWRL